MNKIYSLLLAAIVLCSSLGNLHAQGNQVGNYSIGTSGTPPNIAVLQLVSKYNSGSSSMVGGLLLPQLSDADKVTMMAQSEWSAAAAKGLTIYNTTSDCVEVWNGTKWLSICGSIANDSVSHAFNPAAYAAGTGTFSGKTCFDVAKGNNNANGCGLLTTRLAQQTNFTLTAPQDPAATPSAAPYTGTQVYTFTPSGTVSNVRFAYVESTTGTVTSITPAANYTGSVSSACKATVVYNNNLNTLAGGLSEAQAIKVDIYACYTSAGTDYAVKLTAKIKDCACCGAMVSATEWKPFMCHNLGADVTLDPATPVQGINGSYYQWGATTPAATATTPNAAISGWNSTVYSAVTLWSDVAKTANDPCPTGWRVPTKAQWDGVIANNTTTAVGTWNSVLTNFGAGVKIGNSLFLPAAGYRYSADGQTIDRATWTYYWSSTVYGDTYRAYIYYGQGSSGGTNAHYTTDAYPVRCIAE